MTLQKKLKKTIRARSQKTGESYTAARRQVLTALDQETETPPPAPAAPPAPPPPAEAPRAETPRKATRGEVTDDAARKKTGHGLDHWFAVLEAFGTAEKGHTAAAAHLHREHGIPAWYAQGITVAFERAHGLRDVNQSCTGTFQVSVSKTVAVPVSEVIEALTRASRRADWLAGADPGLVDALDQAFSGDQPREVKTKGSDYAWLRLPWDGRVVEIRITGKPTGASVTADNGNLPSPDLIETRRAQWKLALSGLKRHLEG